MKNKIYKNKFLIILFVSFLISGFFTLYTKNTLAAYCLYGPGTGNCSLGTCDGVCCSGNCCEGACSCTPNCTGKVCGSNGCGGSCGTCDWNTQDCTNGQCVPKTTTTTQGTTTTTQGTTTTTQGTTTTTSVSNTCTAGGGACCSSNLPCPYGASSGSCGSGQKCCDGACGCAPGSTLDCYNGGCPGKQTCSSLGLWGSCVKNDPCCNVGCLPGEACSDGNCVTICTKCPSTPSCFSCSPYLGWYCQCDNPVPGGYTSCYGIPQDCTPGCDADHPCPIPLCQDCVNGQCANKKPLPDICQQNTNCGHVGEACCPNGCYGGLKCCGNNICASLCPVCTPNSTSLCSVTINGETCDGTKTCKSDGTGWADECKPIKQTCGYKTCTWKECDADGVNCNVDKSGTFKYNESCPVGCETNGCHNENCTWKTCENNDCTKINTGIYPKGQCPTGCKSKDECTTTHTCTWKECDTTNQTCSITKSGDYPISQSCPTGCTSDSQCRPSINYSCNTSTGQCYQDSSGAYSSLSSCQNHCSITPPVSSSITLFADKTQVDINEEVIFTAKGSGDLNQSYGLDWNIGDVTPCKYHDGWTNCGKFKNCTKMGGGMPFNNNSYLPIISNLVKPLIAQQAQAVNLSSTLTYSWSKKGNYNVQVQGKNLAGNPVTSNTVTINVGGVPPTTTTKPGPTTTTKPLPPTCQIFDFKINDKDNTIQNPLIVWVNASLTGYFSVNDSCKTCTVSSDDTWGDPPQTYPITTLKSSYTETFKITTAGTYSYTLECVGADPKDIVTDILSLATVKAINLPWWREIIPHLLPFLRGMIR